MSKRSTFLVVGLLAAGIALGGCEGVSRVVQRAGAERTGALLAAAGFRIEPAITAERLAIIRTDRPFELHRHTDGDDVHYTYSDPDRCVCRYVGDSRHYERYQRLREGQRIADAEMSSVWLDQDLALDRDGRRWW